MVLKQFKEFAFHKCLKSTILRKNNPLIMWKNTESLGPIITTQLQSSVYGLHSRKKPLLNIYSIYNYWLSRRDTSSFIPIQKCYQ